MPILPNGKLAKLRLAFYSPLFANAITMDKIVFISLSKDDLQSIIIDCVNSCLKHHNRQEPTTTEPREKLLTVKETAEFLSLSVPTIYSKVSRGELPVMKRSKRLYFSNLELMDYLKQGRQLTNDEIEQEAEKYLSK